MHRVYHEFTAASRQQLIEQVTQWLMNERPSEDLAQLIALYLIDTCKPTTDGDAMRLTLPDRATA